MISRISQTDAIRSYSPAGLTRSPSAVPTDGYTPGNYQLGGIYSVKPEWRTSPQAPRSVWKTAVLTAVMTAGATSGMAAMTATPAMAAEVTQAAPQNLKDQGLKLLLSSRATRGEHVPVDQALAQMKPEAAARVRSLPPEAQQAYVNLEPGAKSWLNERIQGKTSAALGLIQIDNREAFIKGEAVGQNVFDIARSGLKKQIKAGTIPAELEGRLNGVVDLLARMSPEQRGNLVGALEIELGTTSR